MLVADKDENIVLTVIIIPRPFLGELEDMEKVSYTEGDVI